MLCYLKHCSGKLFENFGENCFTKFLFFEKFSERINYVSITGLSNVTGIINPINEIAKIVHKYDVYLIVDAAQMAAQVPIQMSGFDNKNMEIDVLLFSGHKTYAPGSPGVIVARKSFMSAIEPEEVGCRAC